MVEWERPSLKGYANRTEGGHLKWTGQGNRQGHLPARAKHRKKGVGRHVRNRSEAGGQSITSGQGFWKPLKKLSVAGDEAVRDTGASLRRTLPAKQKEP